MEMTGEQRIEAPRDKVWAALNDPQVLKQCIPGCQSLEMAGDNRMKAVAAIKVGPIGARFTGDVTLTDLDPPNGYRIEGEGQGGPAGFAKGGAKVSLQDDGAATILTYEVSAQVGGKLAQLGGAVIDATAKQMAGAFFKRLSDQVAPAVTAASAAAATPTEAVAPAPAASADALVRSPVHSPAAPQAASKGSPIAWCLAVVVGVLAGVLIGGGASGATSAWAGLSIGLLIIIVAAAAFEFGRRANSSPQAPVIVLDSALLAQLSAGAKEGRS